VARIEIGKSTKDDVLAILGLPNRRESKAFEGTADMEVWIYYRGHSKSSFLVPVGGVPAGDFALVFLGQFESRKKEKIVAVVVFDEEGVVVDVKSIGDKL